MTAESVVVRGVELALHPTPDYVSDHLRGAGDFYEIAVLEEVERRLRDVAPGVLVDVGAMIGNHTAYLARFVPHTRIYAFEPSEVNRAILARTTAPFETVTIVPLALSDRAAVDVPMAIARDNRGWSTIIATEPNLGTQREPMDLFVAETRTLDSFELDDVRLVKVDVEHHEPQVLAGARETLARCRPLVVLEDWTGGTYAELLPGYRLAVSWQHQHQTYLYEPVAP